MTNNELDMSRPGVLVVDDDSTIREMLRASLEAQYQVTCLPSGEGVLRAIEEFRPRLLVLDVNMPGGDGHAVCEKVRAEARNRKLPILFITVRRDDATFLKALQSGGDALLLKPFEIGTLREKLRYLLDAYPRR